MSHLYISAWLHYGRHNFVGQDHCSDIRYETIMQAIVTTGLKLNPTKCESIDFNLIQDCQSFEESRRIEPENVTLLGAPVLKAQQLPSLVRQSSRPVQGNAETAHDAVLPLRSCISMPNFYTHCTPLNAVKTPSSHSLIKFCNHVSLNFSTLTSATL